MVNANELRIGNWVGSDGYKTVKQIHSRYIQFQDDSDYVVFPIALTHIQPIPLTPEILEKCGFKGIGSDFEINEVHVYSGHHEFWYWNDKVEVKLTSLHQLQNLYFALTGEELNVQL